MKKSLITVIFLLSLLLIAGCINYKSYEPKEVNSDLLKEIEAIEKELDAEASEPQEKVEEVVISNLDEQSTDSPTTTSEMQIIKVKENEKVSLKPKLVDPDNDPITVTYSKPLDENGQWKTSYGDEGEYIVTITATDGTSTTRKQVKLIVERVNVAPMIENIRDLTIREGETVNYIPTVTDQNGDLVQVRVSPPLNNGEFKTDHASAGEYQISVTASDGKLTTEKTFKLTIKDVNVQPEINGLPAQLTKKEGETLILKPEVSDADGDPVTVTISNPVGDDGIWKLSYTDNGEYSVTVTANDGKETVTKTVNVIVEDVNAPVEILDINVEVN